MLNEFKKAFAGVVAGVVQPLISRPAHMQVAAACLRDGKAGREVLLITSRGTGRWVLPKGWPMDGKKNHQAALQEAWEEAGVKRAKVTPVALGVFSYDKILDGGLPLPVQCYVYAAEVEKLSDDYPEVDERKRRWVPVAKAATMVQEPELQALLAGL